MKKLVQYLLAGSLLLLSACAAPAKKAEEGKLRITVTVFPIYDWVREITAGTDTEITLLMDNGADMHNFQPTAADMIALSESDLFIYIGGESDEWTEEALNNAVNTDMHIVCLLEVLGERAREEETKEGMEAEEEEEELPDEHVWMSVRNAELFVQAVTDTLTEIDPAQAETYRKNSEVYQQELQTLDEEYTEMRREAERDTILVADRFPLLYLTADYGIDYYAAFRGCSAETEASFETVRFLTEKTDELDLNYVLTIDGSTGKIAETVIRNSNEPQRKILSLNSMQGISRQDIDAGVSYLGIMKDNLQVLKTALAE